jgi:hypothetical protein
MMLVKRITKFDHLVNSVKGLNPGWSYCVSFTYLSEIRKPFEYHGVIFEVEDQVLENIVGSSYEYSYVRDDTRKQVTFTRHILTSNRRFYISPDQREKELPKDR